MEVIILTGMSGAGKSVAANFLEDMGYFCVDNVPPQMLKDMIEAFARWESLEGVSIKKAAFVVDIRGASVFKGVKVAMEHLLETGADIDIRLIYLEASDEVLLSRYKQSRRNHPLADGIGILEALKKERALMSGIKEISQEVIDTSNIDISEFREILSKMISGLPSDKNISILVQSFGFKYGIPTDSDNVFDVRFIPNPFYIHTLRPFSGLDKEVYEYVFSFDITHEFMQKVKDIIVYALPYYIKEGKVRLNIGIGCTGGRHRSVAMAEELTKFLLDKGYNVSVNHRDLRKDRE